MLFLILYKVSVVNCYAEDVRGSGKLRDEGKTYLPFSKAFICEKGFILFYLESNLCPCEADIPINKYLVVILFVFALHNSIDKEN